MREMFFGEPPEFGAMMAMLKVWEVQYNRIRELCCFPVEGQAQTYPRLEPGARMR